MTLHLDSLLFGYFYGAMFIVVLYNLVLFVSLREQTYLYYLLFLSTLTLSTYVWEAWAAPATSSPLSSWHRWSLPLLDTLTAGSAVQFTRAYLTTGLTPRMQRLLRWLFVVALVTSGRALLEEWALQMWLWSCPSLAAPVLLLITGMLCARQGNRQACIYIAATTALLLGILTEVVGTALPVAPSLRPLWMEYGIYLGALLMVTIFALGMTERYKASVQEKESAEAANRALQLLSYKDGLTGVWNRRQFDAQLAIAWQHRAETHTPLSLMLIDVDCFKQYNDTYGHQAGDDCLRRVARALSSTCNRPTDLVARYGGEEFAVLLPGADSRDAQVVAEAVRAAVEGLGIPHTLSKAGPYVTISVGVATDVPEAQETWHPFIAEADQALYAAKATGRNRVVGVSGLTAASTGSCL
jgi:diguanylate cyclase (GGDEF)-like protein